MLQAVMDEADVAHSVVITSDRPGDGPMGPLSVLDTVRGSDRITVVEGVLLEGPHATDLEAAERRLREGTTRGLKFYPGYQGFAVNDPRLEEAFTVAARCKAPILFHTGDTEDKRGRIRDAHPLLLDEVASAFPETRFVMCHAGNPWVLDAAAVVHKNENVVADLSGFGRGPWQPRALAMVTRRLNDMIGYLEDCCGRLMFGTDWPLAEAADYVRILDGLDLNEEELEWTRWRTAAEVYGIELPAAKG